ncbi:MAG: crossover junction endodeoxyribonuclease RuvC [Bacteroidota bacterium]|jgi:crossover junction endodeoxyribonuclease RuvC|nr:crossover junction endodeoxyribonuclease RuvC [Bacteroidota bacterium]MDP4230197.1 crossover junction endodeoxyribonuclease RuvC [Bacteroidota bacterium]MDP4237626.1 crossover junction endodeoxyribonuclease RuvC [Bacteroidota bacterium]
MIILGVDPGTLVTGYGVIEMTGKSHGSFRAIEFGTIESKKISSMPKRLETIFTRLQAVIKREKPDEFAIETSFYDKNAQSAMKLGQARGVALVTAQLAGLEIAEYAPRVIKKAVTGNGNADKSQVEFMVRRLLNISEHQKQLPDAYDALAIAITHALRRGTGSKSSKTWKDFIENNPDRIKKK